VAFDMLQDPAVNKHAADQAATADIVVLSAHSGSNLSPKSGCGFAGGWKPSRVMAFGSDCFSRSQSSEPSDEARLLASLRTMVESAGVDLIPHYGETKNSLARSAERMWERAEATNSLFPEGIPPRPTTYENWDSMSNRDLPV